VSIGAFTDQADAHARTEARAEARRHERIAIAHRAGWPELPRRHLSVCPYTVTDQRDGSLYTINRGEVNVDSANITAYYIDPNGDPVFLEERAKR
jgi:hypothetical protein